MEPEAYNYVPSVFDAATIESGPLKEAKRQQRLLNFIIDGAACLLLFYPVGYLVSATLYSFGADLFDAVQSPLREWPSALVLFLFIVGAYYAVFETATSGRSLGKWISGTIAVRDDGQPLSPRKALVRSLWRLLPFEPLSALVSRPWHDRFSKTRVVHRVKSFALKESLLPDSSANYDIRA